MHLCEHFLETWNSAFVSCQGALVLVGTVYTAYIALRVLYALYDFMKIHIYSQLCPVNLHYYGEWAAVTGCTSGIGKEFAEELASQGFNLALLSRPGKVERLAEIMAEKHKVKVIPIPINFSEGRPVYEKIKEQLSGLQIGLLVNNVGVMHDYPMYYTEVAEEKIWDLINVNVAAASMVTHMVLPGMVLRGKGTIINVASVSACRPVPLMAAYSATKTYSDFLSRSLREEYRNKGIVVQTLVPFYVATNMTRYTESLAKPSLFVPSPEQYAQHALKTFGYASRTTGYWAHTIQWWASQLIPDWLFMRVVMKFNSELKRQGEKKILKSSAGSK